VQASNSFYDPEAKRKEEEFERLQKEEEAFEKKGIHRDNSGFRAWAWGDNDSWHSVYGVTGYFWQGLDVFIGAPNFDRQPKCCQLLTRHELAIVSCSWMKRNKSLGAGLSPQPRWQERKQKELEAAEAERKQQQIEEAP
jgi:hypothetical protein